MAKPRVHEIAKELGVPSKDLIAKLNELGEYVKGPSSTLEAPVVRKAKEAFPAPTTPPKEAAPKAKAAAKPAPKPAAPKPAAPEPAPEPEAKAPEPRPHRPPASLPRTPRRPPQAKAESAAPAQDKPASADAPRSLSRRFPATCRVRARGPAATTRSRHAPAVRASVPAATTRSKRPVGEHLARVRAVPLVALPARRPGALPAVAVVPLPAAHVPAASRRVRRRPRWRTRGGRPGFGGPPGSRPAPGGRGRGGGTAGAFGRQGGRPARGRKSKRAKRMEYEQQQAPSIGGVQIPRGDGNTPLRLRRGATLSDFADRIDVNPASLVTVLFHLGEMATATQSLDEDTFQALGEELGYKITIVSPEEEDRELLEDFGLDLEAELEAETDEDLEVRPPVVTVMGHVDHGKTRLLDSIRKADVVSGEAGGITQHIGAYQVHREHDGTTRAITFIDTPGHEAFTAMRARGAQVTDVAILVVAADDGVMPQTVEALNHAQAADVPIVVAINKIDKEGANPDKIRQQLTEYNLVAEEYGGDTMFVEVSATQGKNIEKLLDAVLLTADAGLDLRANPNKDARGVAVEAHLDKGRGPVATVLVQSGTLRVGDAIVAGTAYGRVRAMFNEHDEPVQRRSRHAP